MNILAAEAEGGNYRLCAPLVLYAVSSGKIDHLLRSLGSSSVADEMRRRLREFSEGPLDQMLASEAIPRDYKKVWEAFRVEKNAPDREKALKEAIVKGSEKALNDFQHQIFVFLQNDVNKLIERNAFNILNDVMSLGDPTNRSDDTNH